MNLITIDAEKCKRDGICVAECPVRLLVLKPDAPTPVLVPGADEICIHCGHCVAVCPHGALSHRDMQPESCPPVRPELTIRPEQAEHFLRSRRSIRTYKKAPVPKDVLSKVIDIARFAPSGHNSQPVKWIMIHDSAELHRLTGMVIDWMRYVCKEHPKMAQPLHMDAVIAGWEAGLDPVCRKAPHLIIACGDKTNPMAQTASIIALTYAELAAFSMGLGACWAGYFNAAATFWPPLQQALELPENHVCFGAMMLGYPQYAYHRLPRRKEADITWR